MKKEARPDFDMYGNRVEKITKDDNNVVMKIYMKNKEKISQIKSSGKCHGDKIHDIIKSGITNNAIYAKKLLEIS